MFIFTIFLVVIIGAKSFLSLNKHRKYLSFDKLFSLNNNLLQANH